MTDRTIQQAPDPAVVAGIAHEAVAGELVQDQGQWVLTMRRRFPATPERLWDKLTQPGQIAGWAPHVPDRPLTAVGAATAQEQPGEEAFDVEVLEVDPPKTLEHRWGKDVLRWTVAADGDESLLTLEHRFGDRGDAPSYGAGWHICLAVLAALVEGRAVERVVSSRANDYGWQELHDRYAAALGL